MRILIITQNEPFYLTKSLRHLLDILPKNSEVVGCVVNDVSPFGKKESFFTKAKNSSWLSFSSTFNFLLSTKL